MIKPEADYVFEVSWEVCNKVGGIYTVLKSKAAQMMKLYRNYFLIGPYFENSEKIDFSRLDVPNEFRPIFEKLKKEGITCYFGRWEEVKGKPLTILVDFKDIVGQKDNIKGMYWNDFKIDSMRGYWDFEEPAIWSYTVGKLIAEIKENMLKAKKVVAHFHEWLAAFGLLYLKKNSPNVSTAFTTHATTLGRVIASSGRELYAGINNIDPMREAYNNGVEAKHLTERAAAINADVFTTVSEITSIEAEKFLGRKAEVLVLNGLDIEKFPSFEETSIKHIASRDKIREFLAYYFFPYYTFKVDHNLIFYTVGRYEFRNKGYDMIIKSLGRLNEILKKNYQNLQKNKTVDSHTNPEEEFRTISVFFWIPMENHGIRLDVLENKNYYMHIKNYVNSNAPEILTRLIYDFISKQDHIDADIFTENFLNEIKKDIIAFERKGNPPISTHNVDEKNNALFIALRENGLLNRKEDFVKVIVEPVYLDGTDGFIDLAYYDSMVGCHLGLFPSYYEPWGYTPLESVALGVPALTTDLSGYGMFIKNKNLAKSGMFVLERLNKDEEYVLNEFTNMLYDFTKLSHSERVEYKMNAKSTSGLADWKMLIDNYVEAHNLALKNNVEKKIPKKSL